MIVKKKLWKHVLSFLFWQKYYFSLKSDRKTDDKHLLVDRVVL